MVHAASPVLPPLCERMLAPEGRARSKELPLCGGEPAGGRIKSAMAPPLCDREKDDARRVRPGSACSASCSAAMTCRNPGA